VFAFDCAAASVDRLNLGAWRQADPGAGDGCPCCDADLSELIPPESRQHYGGEVWFKRSIKVGPKAEAISSTPVCAEREVRRSIFPSMTRVVTRW
jgi:hypothetical protein